MTGLAERDPDLVWSTTEGDLRRRRPAPPPGSPPAAAAGRVKVRREIAKRRGKAVTTVAGAPLDDAGLRELAGALKKRCGVGGTVKGGVIELQGDHRTAVVTLLRARGYDVVLAGG